MSGPISLGRVSRYSMERQAPVGTVAMSAAFPSMAAFPVSLHAHVHPRAECAQAEAP